MTVTETKTLREPQAPVKRTSRQDTWAAWVFLLPNIVGTGGFVVLPVLAGLLISFTSWDMLSAPTWVGLENYRTLLFRDPLFWLSLGHTLLYAVIVIPVGTLLSLGLALALNSGVRGAGIYQGIFFLPYVASTISVALVWKWMYHPDYGVFNSILTLLRLPTLGWITDRSLALVAVAIVAIWQAAGYNMVIFLAGLRAIPASYYEAARIDGSSGWQAFWFITVPLLRPSMLFVLITSLIASFQVFNLVYIMTNNGPGNSTLVYVTYLWSNAFSYFKMGYASAMAYLLFICMILVTFVYVRLLGRRLD